MEIYEGIPDELSVNTAVCIGKFDGIHKGHMLLIDKAIKSGYPVCMFTFIFKDALSIYSRKEKIDIAKLSGIDYYVEIVADKDFFDMSPERFIKDILTDRLHARCVVVGEDFRFGKDRSGDVTTLIRLAAECGYEFFFIKKLKDNGDVISSTSIRTLIKNGDIKRVNHLLDRPYQISGKVIGGHEIGRTIGFPTANIAPDKTKLLPPYGVYAVCLRTDDDKCEYKGIGNLGVKPTIGDDEAVGLEVHIFDHEIDLYGKMITVYMLDFIREEKKFSSTDELKAQIEDDIRVVRDSIYT